MSKKLKDKVEINDGDYVIVDGDFNARMTEKGGRLGNSEHDGKRISKDKGANKEGKQLKESRMEIKLVMKAN